MKLSDINGIKKYDAGTSDYALLPQFTAPTGVTIQNTPLATSSRNYRNTKDLPFISGAKNQNGIGKAVPFFIGQTKFAPYILNDGFYTLSSVEDDCFDQWFNTILGVGFNPAIIQKVNIGEKTVLELEHLPTDEGIHIIPSGTYQAANKLLSKVEIESSGDLILEGLNKKVVCVDYNEEIKHDFGAVSEPLIKDVGKNVLSIEVGIKFEGLRSYDSESEEYYDRTVTINPYWSNDNGNTWNLFYFDIKQARTEPTYAWRNVYNEEELIASGKIIKKEVISNKVEKSGTWSKITFTYYDLVSASADYQIEYSGNIDYLNGTDNRTYKILERYITTPADERNQITRNATGTMRFIASTTLTAEQSYNKNILVKVERANPKQEESCDETAILMFIQTFNSDAKTSTASKLEPCSELRLPLRDKVKRMGVRILSNDNTKSQLDEVNVIITGLARVWNSQNKTWSSYKEVTRNPAAWILEILTTDTQPRSKFLDSEIDLLSLGKLYEYCERMNFYCDGVITNGIKKGNLIADILGICNASFAKINNKLVFFYDDVVEEVSGLINAQNIKSIQLNKSFKRRIDGYKVTYIKHDDYQQVTEYIMANGRNYNSELDTITEINLDFVQTHEHAYKLILKKLKQQELQPREIIVEMNKDAKVYELYSVVDFQFDAFYQGLRSSLIHDVVINNGNLDSIRIADSVTFEPGKRYGIVLQAQNSNGKRRIQAEVTGEGTTKTIHFVDEIPAIEDGISVTYGNNLSFGELSELGEFNKICCPMKVMDISRNSEGYTLTLRNYDPAIYTVGPIPEYKSNITKRPDVKAEVTPITKAEAADASKASKGPKGDKGDAGGLRVLNSLSEEGTEGDSGIYNGRVYVYIRGVWNIANSDGYIGHYETLPPFQLGNYFLCTKDFIKNNVVLKANNGILGVSPTVALGLLYRFEKGFIYECKETGWSKVENKNDYRYLISMMDSYNTTGEIPAIVQTVIDTSAEKVANEVTNDIVDDRVGTFNGLLVTDMENPVKGDFYCYNGTTTATRKKGYLYKYDGEKWNELNPTDAESYIYHMQALQSSLAIASPENGAFSTLFANILMANNAVIQSLQSSVIKLQERIDEKGIKHKGVIYGGNRYNEDGTDNNKNAKGFYEDTEGNFKTSQATIENMNITGNAIVRGNLNSTDFDVDNVTGFSFPSTNDNQHDSYIRSLKCASLRPWKSGTLFNLVGPYKVSGIEKMEVIVDTGMHSLLILYRN